MKETIVKGTAINEVAAAKEKGQQKPVVEETKQTVTEVPEAAKEQIIAEEPKAPADEQEPKGAEDQKGTEEQSTAEDNQEQPATEQPLTISSLFKPSNAPKTFSAGNQLNKTAELTKLSEEIARDIMNEINANPAKYVSSFEASMKDHGMMDDLINQIQPLDDIPTPFLVGVSDADFEKMIRSQQSKRSRAKSKEMFEENYLTMMVGAIAENLLRIASKKPKAAGGYKASVSDVYSEEEIEEFKKDKEKLNKAIRNVQSKKSIYKASAEFATHHGYMSPKWLNLCNQEEQLKALRGNTTTVVSAEAQKALEATKKAEELLATIDESKLKDLPADVQAMFDSLKDALASKE